MKRVLAVLALLFLASSSKAGPGGCTNSPSLFPFAFEQITVSTTALPLTQATAFPSGQQPAALAVVTVETNAVRYRDDGLNPTAAAGMPVAAASSVTVCGEATIRRIKFIRQTADATLSVAYYREGGN